jgi:diguanylate cyclase (GGDEF)-like protein/PAS domain S-box-containing protein
VERELEMLGVAVEAAANAIAIIDLDGTFMWVNEAFERLTGYTRREVIGAPTRLLRSGVHPPSYYEALWGTVLAGEVWRGETWNRRKDGTVYLEEQTIAPVRGEGGILTHFVSIKTDVTERREAELALQWRIREIQLLRQIASLGISDLEPQAIIDCAVSLIQNAFELETCSIELNAPTNWLETMGLRSSPPPPVREGELLKLPLHVGKRPLGALRAALPRADASSLAVLLGTVAQQLSAALERACLVEELRRLATSDPLTGIMNRRAILKLLDEELDRAHRYARPLALAVLDVDHFKRVNDRYGHAAGDAVLVGVARAFASELRGADGVGRIGGEEFVMVLPETSQPGAQRLAERLRVALEEAVFSTPQGDVRATVSVGVATLGPDCCTRDELLNRADQALYLAKQSGRNRVVTWSGVRRAREASERPEAPLSRPNPR